MTSGVGGPSGQKRIQDPRSPQPLDQAAATGGASTTGKTQEAAQPKHQPGVHSAGTQTTQARQTEAERLHQMAQSLGSTPGLAPPSSFSTADASQPLSAGLQDIARKLAEMKAANQAAGLALPATAVPPDGTREVAVQPKGPRLLTADSDRVAQATGKLAELAARRPPDSSEIAKQLETLGPAEFMAVVQRLDPQALGGILDSQLGQTGKLKELASKSDKATVDKLAHAAYEHAATEVAGRRNDAVGASVLRDFGNDLRKMRDALPDSIAIQVGDGLSSPPAAGGGQGPKRAGSEFQSNPVMSKVPSVASKEIEQFKAQYQDTIKDIWREAMNSKSPDAIQKAVAKLEAAKMTAEHKLGQLGTKEAKEKFQEKLNAISDVFEGGINALQAYQNGDTLGLAANAAKFGSGGWAMFGDRLKSALGEGAYDKIGNSLGVGGAAASAVIAGLDAVDKFQRDDKIGGSIAALQCTGETWGVLQTVFKSKIPEQLGANIAKALAAGPVVASSLRESFEAYQRGDKRACAQHLLQAGSGTANLGAAMLQTAGYSPNLAAGLGIAAQVGADAVALAPHVSYLINNPPSLTDEQYTYHLAEAAKIGGADFVGALVLGSTGSPNAALLARGMVLTATNLVQSGLTEHEQNIRKSNEAFEKLSNDNAISNYARKRLGLQGAAIQNFKEAFRSGDPMTRAYMRGIFDLSRTDPQKAASEFQRLLADGQLSIGRWALMGQGS